MAYEKISIHNYDLESRKELFRKMVSPTEYDLVMKHLRQLANGELSNRAVGERRQLKLLDMFTIFYKNINKPSSKIVKGDLSKLKEDLMNDRILKANNNPYSPDTKEDCIDCVRRFYECTYPAKISSFASVNKPFNKWFRLRSKGKTPEIITEEEVKKLIEKSKSIEGKFLITLLFDSGARIEELLNIRFEDIEPPTINFPYYKIDFKREYSKTEGRKIGLYWGDITTLFAKYLQVVERKDEKNRLIDKDYDAVRMFLGRLGKKVLNKRITPHMFRKGSATYYASRLNRQQLCVRYGWKFSSEMPDVYISRAGVDEEKIKEVVFNDDLNVMKKSQNELQVKYDLVIKEFERYKKEQGDAIVKKQKELEKTFAIMKQRIDGIKLPQK